MDKNKNILLNMQEVEEIRSRGNMIVCLSIILERTELCMASEASRERTVCASERQSRVGRMSSKFSFLLRPEEAQYIG